MTYLACKKLIEIGKYNEEELLNKLDIFLLNRRLTEKEYSELIGMMV